MALEILILAAGQGKRMRSDLPKVLHPLAGRPMLAHVLDTARALSPRKMIVVHGHGAEQVKKTFPEKDVEWALQAEQLGTAHAVMQAMPLVSADADVLVLYGDMPMVRVESLRRLLDAAPQGLAVLTAEIPNHPSFGRVVRNAAGVQRIVEVRDASPAERALSEVNMGFYALSARRLAGWLKKIGNANAQKEYYLTDLVALAVTERTPVVGVTVEDPVEAGGVNSKGDLAQLERLYQGMVARRLLDAGVTLADPARIDVRGALECGRDVAIDVNCVFEGRVTLGDGVRIGANCVLRNITVAAGSQILPFCHLEDSSVGERCRLGPYARLRPGTSLDEDVHVGNFVEVKASRLRASAKANHLTYIGDSDVGARTNVGAGTITCNYDGVNKHKTVIEDDCFIGSDATLVAPLRIARGSYIGAGSTINKDTPAGQLTVARAKQVSLPGWKPPKKKA
jgi:bifunctional UDP-N-acetylglucosamine pyrophosphorylase / glucosamine-1-phosphate N-acetyltransferase